MGIEGLDLQKPPVPLHIFLQKLQPCVKGTGLGVVRLSGDLSPVNQVLPSGPLAHSADGSLQAVHAKDDRSKLLRAMLFGAALPFVVFLSAENLPAGISFVVGSAAVLGIVEVVCSQVRMDPRLTEQLRHGIVKGLDGAPAAVEQIRAAGVKFPPGGHTGERTDIAIIKNRSLLRQAFEIGQLDFPAVAGQQIPAQGIIHNHNRFHKRRSPFSA